MKLKIALLQMTSCGSDQEANLLKGEDFCRQAARMKADLVLFPEMWNIGYTFFDPAQPGAQEQWQAQAVGPDDRFVRHFKALAQELKLAIALTYLERWSDGPRNSVSFIDRHGQMVLTYAKVHTCAFDLEAACTPGDDFYVADLDTAAGTVKVGAMTCFDREFPESARILMLKGAELILTPNACELEANRLGQFRARAFENMVSLAMTNYAAPQANGHSFILDGIAFEPNGQSREMGLIEAGPEEGVYLAEVDLAALRAYREREVWGNAFRRPSSYGPLTTDLAKEQGRQIFFEYACNHFYMDHDGLGERYKTYGISQAEERQWRREYISFWTSQLSSDDLTALNRLTAARAGEALPDLLRLAGHGDGYAQLWYANALWELATGVAAPPTIREQAIQTAAEMWHTLCQQPIELTDAHRALISLRMQTSLEAATPEEYILNYARRQLGNKQLKGKV